MEFILILHMKFPLNVRKSMCKHTYTWSLHSNSNVNLNWETSLWIQSRKMFLSHSKLIIIGYTIMFREWGREGLTMLLRRWWTTNINFRRPPIGHKLQFNVVAVCGMTKPERDTNHWPRKWHSSGQRWVGSRGGGGGGGGVQSFCTEFTIQI